MATYRTGQTANIGDTPSLDALAELMRKFRSEHPPGNIIVRAEMSRDVWKHLHSLECVAPRPESNWMPSISGIPVTLNDVIPPNCYSMEFADGHADMVTPTGSFRIKEPCR